MTMMTSLLRSLLCLFLFAAAAVAQGAPEKVELKFIIPDKFERATRLDDQGLLQWDTFKEENCPTCNGTKVSGCALCQRLDDKDNKNCPECKGTRKATCRPCGGLGHWPDPLKKVHCPGCMGSGLLVCGVCGGRGWQKITGNGDKPTDCVGCRGAGGWKCGVCNGARLVEVVSLKPSLEEAPAPALTKALEQIDAVLKGVEGFNPNGKNARKEVKDLVAVMQKGKDTLPPMKRSPKAFEDMMGKVYAGSVFEGHEDMFAETMKLFASNMKYYLQHQKRIVELCLKRAEANAKVQGEKKKGE